MKSQQKPTEYICPNGTVEYRLPNGQYHRKNGPAILYPDGSQSWYLYDKLHRENGPAIISNSAKGLGWYVKGVYIKWVRK